MNTRIWSSLVLALVSSAGCVAAAEDPSTATEEAALATSLDWAVAWVDGPTTGHVSTTWQATSNGAVITGTHPSTGHYALSVPGIGALVGGNVQISTYGTNAHCGVLSWWSLSTALQINVQCFAPGTGAAMDSSWVRILYDGRKRIDFAELIV